MPQRVYTLLGKFIIFLRKQKDNFLAIKLAKLKQHLITMHPEYKAKTKYFFSRNIEEYTRQKTKMVNMATISEQAQKASYLVA